MVQPDIRLGLSDAEWKGMLSNTLGHVAQGYIAVQRLQTADGKTLAVWASVPGLDPQGHTASACRSMAPVDIFGSG
ncbi:hypothetical protein [Deinococcus sp.]|uniref:hypothetical protein n=1 Tax=Deinococcus sp. TaxID=47478 RepID=UPI003CC5D6A7